MSDLHDMFASDTRWEYNGFYPFAPLPPLG